MKRPGGITAIAIWYLATGVLALLSFCALIGLPAFGFFSNVFEEAGLYALASLGLCFGVFFLLDAVLSLAAGWGMLKLQEWGRLLGIFLAIFTLFAFPVGTVIGAVILWYLFQREAKVAFGSTVDADYTVYATSGEVPPIEETDFKYYPPQEHTEPPPPTPMAGTEMPPPPSPEAIPPTEGDPGDM